MSEDVFRWVVTIGVLLACASAIVQAFVMVALLRTGKELRQAGKEAEGKIAPLLENLEAIASDTRKILEENRPRIGEISKEALATTKAVRERTERLGELIDDFSARAKNRIEQIDHTVDHTVEQVEHASEAVRSAVLTPVKEVTGFVNGVKAAVATYTQNRHRSSVEHATQDEEMFI